MSPGDRSKINPYISAASASSAQRRNAYAFCSSLASTLAFVALTISLAGCAHSGTDIRQAEQGSGRGLLSNLRPKADPALVASITEQEREEALKRSQAAIYAETAGPEQIQPGLGRTLPKVSTDPFSSSLIAPAAEDVSANGTILDTHDGKPDRNRAIYSSATPMSSYEGAYNAVPPPPPGALGAGLVPPPPAVTLSTQAQPYAGVVADAANNFYNNPYFNPFGVPAPQQAAMPTRRPAGLFGEARDQSDANSESGDKRHKANFVPITPKGMESRSAYKQRDDLRVLWKGALKSSVNLGALSENDNLIQQLAHQDIGLPAESSKGTFNVSPRLIESLFKSSAIDKRAFPQIRKVQTELAQSYYRYLYSYNKYALAEQTVAARKQEVELSDSDAEKQRAAADLAQTQTDLEASKEDLHSSEIELAAASSPTSARSVISRVAGIAPSVEALAQGISQNGLRNNDVNHERKLIGFLDVFKHPHAVTAEAPTSASEDTDLVADKTKVSNDSLANKKKDKSTVNKNKVNLFSRLISHGDNENESANLKSKNAPKNDSNKKKTDIASNDNDLSPSPVSPSISKSTASETKTENVASGTPGNISFILKNVNVNPRKSVLNVVVKNSGSESFELNPDTIYIAEGNRKLGSAALRADFDITSIEPKQEVKGTITVLSRPWNDRLVIYMTDGNKTIQLKR